MTPLPRAYLLGAILALGIGAFVLGHQLVAPVLPVTTGCIEVTFDTLHVPRDRSRRWAQMEACPHFDRTEINLSIGMPAESAQMSGGGVFLGSQTGAPIEWQRHLRVHWRGPDTLIVEHDESMRFISRWDTAGGVIVLYHALGAPDR